MTTSAIARKFSLLNIYILIAAGCFSLKSVLANESSVSWDEKTFYKDLENLDSKKELVPNEKLKLAKTIAKKMAIEARSEVSNNSPEMTKAISLIPCFTKTLEKIINFLVDDFSIEITSIPECHSGQLAMIYQRETDTIYICDTYLKTENRNNIAHSLLHELVHKAQNHRGGNEVTNKHHAEREAVFVSIAISILSNNPLVIDGYTKCNDFDLSNEPEKNKELGSIELAIAFLQAIKQTSEQTSFDSINEIELSPLWAKAFQEQKLSSIYTLNDSLPLGYAVTIFFSKDFELDKFEPQKNIRSPIKVQSEIYDLAPIRSLPKLKGKRTIVSIEQGPVRKIIFHEPIDLPFSSRVYSKMLNELILFRRSKDEMEP